MASKVLQREAWRSLKAWRKEHTEVRPATARGFDLVIPFRSHYRALNSDGVGLTRATSESSSTTGNGGLKRREAQIAS